jgi:hypothetical protein
MLGACTTEPVRVGTRRRGNCSCALCIKGSSKKALYLYEWPYAVLLQGQAQSSDKFSCLMIAAPSTGCLSIGSFCSTCAVSLSCLR